MSHSKPLSPARVADSVLSLFSNVPPSETLAHLIRYLGTWSGSDKFFMVLQYSLQLLIPLLNLRARLQCKAGLRKLPSSDSAVGLGKFAKLISDSRTLWRIWGLLPIFQWLIALERKAPATRQLLNIERLQGWSMLGYYPLEHLSYLTSKEVIPTSYASPLSKKPITLNPGKMSLLSVRCWAAYVVLQFGHLREDHKLLSMQERTFKKAKGAAPEIEKLDLSKRWDAFYSELALNSVNLPLALHWSTPGGLIGNQLVVDAMCWITAVIYFRSGWNATAIPAPPPAPKMDDEVIPMVEVSEASAYDAEPAAL